MANFFSDILREYQSYLFLKEKIKYKYLTEDELIICLDRLSRFKLPENTYERVFFSILTKCLIYPKYSKSVMNDLDAKELSKLVEIIWNASVDKLYGKTGNNKKDYEILKFLIKSTFINIPEKTKIFMNTDLKITEILKNANYEKIPFNLKFLKKTSELSKDKKYTTDELKEIRKKYSLKYPVERIIIAEGITEEILLPAFSNKIGKNFDKEGIYILGAGGKSKSPGLYAKIKDKIKTPVVLLFDADAKEIADLLQPLLTKKDKAVLLEKGEFEDILSPNLIKRTLNNKYEPATPLTLEELRESPRMCKNIEKFYRTRHLGEFKKSLLSELIAENIKYPGDITEEIKELFNRIL